MAFNVAFTSVYPRIRNVFGGTLELACLSVRVYVCVQNIRFCQSAGGAVKSHLVTALVSFTSGGQSFSYLDSLVALVFSFLCISLSWVMFYLSHFDNFVFSFLCIPLSWVLLYPHKRSWGYTGVTLSVRPCVRHEILSGHNFKCIKGSNFKIHIQIGHIVEKCSVQEP